MEKIIINEMLYNLPNGTNDKIHKLLKEADNSPSEAHESGTSHNKYNDFLWDIIETKKGVHVENAYRTT